MRLFYEGRRGDESRKEKWKITLYLQLIGCVFEKLKRKMKMNIEKTHKNIKFLEYAELTSVKSGNNAPRSVRNEGLIVMLRNVSLETLSFI